MWKQISSLKGPGETPNIETWGQKPWWEKFILKTFIEFKINFIFNNGLLNVTNVNKNIKPKIT